VLINNSRAVRRLLDSDTPRCLTDGVLQIYKCWSETPEPALAGTAGAKAAAANYALMASNRQRLDSYLQIPCNPSAVSLIFFNRFDKVDIILLKRSSPFVILSFPSRSISLIESRPF